MAISQLIGKNPFESNEDGKLPQRTLEWSRQVTNLQVLTGSGSPEGVVAAQITTFYMDTSGSAGSILYVKQLADIGGDVTKGWILV